MVKVTESTELIPFWEGATFFPNDARSRIDSLLEKAWTGTQSKFIAFGMQVSVLHPRLFEETGLTEWIDHFKCLPLKQRRELIEFPPFLIWLRQCIRHSSSGGYSETDLRNYLTQLGRLFSAFDESRPSSHKLIVDDAIVFVQRFDIDPLVESEAFPDYCLPNKGRRHELEQKVVYPFSLFMEMVVVTLDRIKQAWPEAHRYFPRFVKIIVDMIDAAFTSYSAPGHRGVIFVSTDNSPLVALEEYFIHEFGHQILYNVMELDPIVNSEAKRTFKLPWSGQERDFYGYFHAFYIYTLLINYLTRVEGRSTREQKRISDRISHIRKGMCRAIPEIEGVNSFTPAGKQLFENLKTEYKKYD